MSLRKVLMFPVVVYVGLRVTFALGPKSVPFVKGLCESFDRRMCVIDQTLPQGSYTHKKAVRKLRKEMRQRLKEAYVKKS